MNLLAVQGHSEPSERPFDLTHKGIPTADKIFLYFIIFLQLAAFGMQAIFMNVISKYYGVSHRDEHGPTSLGLEDIRLHWKKKWE